MTQNPRNPQSTQTVLLFLAVASCLPYLALKVAWIAGSRVGIPDGSPLLDHRAVMMAANGLTVLMDASVVVLALLLTRPWGLRVPSWLPALPMWIASGLLLPIMVGFPIQMLVTAFGGTLRGSSDGGAPDFLEPWVFGVVYGGFILQGLTLGALFVRYARVRWGGLWRGRTAGLPVTATAPAQRAVAVAAAVLGLFPAVTHLLWACGMTAGLNAATIAERSSDGPLLQAVDAVFVVTGVLGALALAFRRGGRLPVAVPFAAAWLGSGATACTGAWLALTSLSGVSELDKLPTPLMTLLYAVQMLVGALIVAMGAHFLAERAARPAGQREAAGSGGA